MSNVNVLKDMGKISALKCLNCVLVHIVSNNVQTQNRQNWQNQLYSESILFHLLTSLYLPGESHRVRREVGEPD